MDYTTLFNQIVDPLKSMMVGAVSFIPTLLTMLVTLVVLALGCVIAHLVTKGAISFMRVIKIDTFADTLGITKVLKNGGIKQKPSTLIGCMMYWVMMVFVFITTLTSFGLSIVGDYLSTIFAYIPNVVTGVLTLIIGMLVARFISGVVYVTAKNTNMPIPETLRDLSQLAIVVYVAIMYLKQIGFVSLFESHFNLFIGGIIFALAIAFGLAGKDIAAKYLSVLDRKNHSHSH